jgi:hypothetical protein
VRCSGEDRSKDIIQERRRRDCEANRELPRWAAPHGEDDERGAEQGEKGGDYGGRKECVKAKHSEEWVLACKMRVQNTNCNS